jgi:16S rRNA (guanine1207-N2)-methyltransferase
MLAIAFEEWAKIDSARHCALFEAGRAKEGSAFELDRHFSIWSLQLADRVLEMHSLPGVFAHGRLDAGSRLLLATLSADSWDLEISGRVLDFACGSGGIGMALAATCPKAHLTLLDDSALALESARRSLAANAIHAELIASDGLLKLLKDGPQPFDWIVSNPPFHRGVREDLAVTERFIRDCPRVLAPGGRLCLVANAHLPYRRWLEELFSRVQVIAADGEYNVWLAS